MNEYDGRLISELGVEKYLKATKDITFSNINFFNNSQKDWDKCNFGCHTPAYRTIRREATWNDTLNLLDKIDPLVAGIADGIHHKVLVEPARLASGVERTAEGLHLAGSEKFSLVGEENWATVELLNAVYESLFKYELFSIDNPFMQCMFRIVHDYISALPEWVLQDIEAAGIFNDSGELDTHTFIKAIQYGVVDHISSEDIQAAKDFTSGKAKRFAGKQIGKKLASAIAAAIALKIAKKILRSNQIGGRLKSQISKIRKSLKPMKGGLGGTLINLLKAQGLLGTAAKASRTLKDKCPTTWFHLRYKLKGCDMIYFLIEPFVAEYVARLSLLEKQPVEFAKVMAALLKEKNTQRIFFPE